MRRLLWRGMDRPELRCNVVRRNLKMSNCRWDSIILIPCVRVGTVRQCSVMIVFRGSLLESRMWNAGDSDSERFRYEFAFIGVKLRNAKCMLNDLADF